MYFREGDRRGRQRPGGTKWIYCPARAGSSRRRREHVRILSGPVGEEKNDARHGTRPWPPRRRPCTIGPRTDHRTLFGWRARGSEMTVMTEADDAGPAPARPRSLALFLFVRIPYLLGGALLLAAIAIN